MSNHPSRLRIGVTMRMEKDPATAEERDALARDWHGFFRTALPDALWLPVPNLGEQAVAFAEAVGLTGLVLTGGNALGEAPQRDLTEERLLRHALDRRLPVLAVCRGLQLVQRLFGGPVQACAGHLATRHAVRFGEGAEREVNSYHRFGVPAAGLASGLRLLAASPDGLAEAFCAEGLLAIQWHPEREAACPAEDMRLTRALFLGPGA